MFTLFGLLKPKRRTLYLRRPSPASYAEVLFAGWVPPPAQPVEIRTVAATAQRERAAGPDDQGFLARVYLNQRC